MGVQRKHVCLSLLGLLTLAAFASAAPQAVEESAKEMFSLAFKKQRATKQQGSLAYEIPTVEASVLAQIHPSNTTNGVPAKKTAMPIDIQSTDGTLVLVSHGLCRESCKALTAQTLTKFSWHLTAFHHTALQYVARVVPTNPNVLHGGYLQTAKRGASAMHGVIPPSPDVAAPNANFTTSWTEFREIEFVPLCRSKGDTTAHITIADAAGRYFPVHFFLRVVCDVSAGDGCSEVDCGRYGACFNGTCSCVEGFSGDRCEHSIFDNCPSKCNGLGTACVANEAGNGYTCQCHDGYSGADCGHATGCNDLDRCSGRGECVNGITCACNPGWTGLNCAESADSDRWCQQLSYCHGREHGQCVEKSSGLFHCQCTSGFTGDDCGIVVPNVCPSACSGKGECKDGSCECAFGYHGADCSQVSSPCGGCLNGKCVEATSDGLAHCICEDGWTGAHCTVFEPSTSPCKHFSHCSGHGKCSQRACVCDAGFGGLDCSVSVAAGCKAACNGNGLCTQADTCKCVEGWAGEDCSVAVCAVYDNHLCSGHGSCVKSGSGGLGCACGEGYSGTACNVVHCQSSTTCNNHGSCVKAVGPYDALCECHHGWEGHFCDVHNADDEHTDTDHHTDTEHHDDAVHHDAAVHHHNDAVAKKAVSASAVSAIAKNAASSDELDDFLDVV